MKIVINRRFGGFSLSKKVLALLPFFFSDGIADDSKEFRYSIFFQQKKIRLAACGSRARSANIMSTLYRAAAKNF